MKQLFGNALRSMKDFFTEPAGDFRFDSLGQNESAADPLFDLAALEPGALQSPVSHQAAILNALARATENYFLTNIAPLLRNVENLRWQIKQIRLHESSANRHFLTEINTLSPAILYTVSKAILLKLPCSHAMDMTHYYGLGIVADSDLPGRNIVTWASIGQDKVALHFSFDDEIIECPPAMPLPVDIAIAQAANAIDPASGVESKLTPELTSEFASGFHLRLTDAEGTHDISIRKFPAIAGNSPEADIVVNGPAVSARHLVLQWDNLLQCVYLTDRSRHGTFLNNGRKLSDGERCNLLGDGSFQLTNHTGAPRFDYWYGAAPHRSTALLPPDVCDALRHFAAHRSDNNSSNNNRNRSKPAMPDDPENLPPAPLALSAAVAVTSPAAAFSNRPLRAARVERGSRSGATTCLVSTAQHTLLSDNQKPGPLAWLQVRNAQKKTETIAITALPFHIGREFDGEGFPVDASYTKVSRIHLRLLEQRGNAFGVNNDSSQRPGRSNLTFSEKGAESRQFVWMPQPRNSDRGWRVLGASRIDGESIEVRLLSADGS